MSRAFIEAVLEQLQRPPVETMGFEELRSEVLALRQNMRTLYGVWQEAEDDAEKACNEGAAWMQGACLEWVRAWIETEGSNDTESLINGLEDIPLPTRNEEGDDDAE
jgi:hypothetical protein